MGVLRARTGELQAVLLESQGIKEPVSGVDVRSKSPKPKKADLVFAISAATASTPRSDYGSIFPAFNSGMLAQCYSLSNNSSIAPRGSSPRVQAQMPSQESGFRGECQSSSSLMPIRSKTMGGGRSPPMRLSPDSKVVKLLLAK